MTADSRFKFSTEILEALAVLWIYGPDMLSLQQFFQMAYSMSAAAFLNGISCVIRSAFSRRHQPNQPPKQDKHTFSPFSHSIDLCSWYQTISHICTNPPRVCRQYHQVQQRKVPALVSTCHLCMSWSMLVAERIQHFLWIMQELQNDIMRHGIFRGD